MSSLIIGRGEIGSALFEILRDCYGEAIDSYDTKDGSKKICKDITYLHICIPYSRSFISICRDYIRQYKPVYTIVHSTVPVGTTNQIGDDIFHSPVRGKHPNIKKGLKEYVKYISTNSSNPKMVSVISEYFEKAGIPTKIIYNTKTTELMKLLELCRYGVYIAFAKEQEKICNHFGLDYNQVVIECEQTRNEGIDEELKQPILYPFKNFVGGHCTVEDMELLLSQVETNSNGIETPLLREAYKIDRATVIHPNCNIYATAKIGKGCSIGQFCEIGEHVIIRNNVRIGAYTFIPEGVIIEDDVFIAPKVSFSNDKHPPSKKNHWGRILIKKGAVIGMGSVILPCVTIGENAVVGAGSVVTKDVPPREVWYGQAAYPHGRKEDIY